MHLSQFPLLCLVPFSLSPYTRILFCRCYSRASCVSLYTIQLSVVELYILPRSECRFELACRTAMSSNGDHEGTMNLTPVEDCQTAKPDPT